MKYLGLILLLGASLAEAGTIIQVSRRLRMSNVEPNPPKDFFIDMGTRDGVREGDVMTVYRFVPVLNVLAGAPHQLLRVVLGEIKILSAGESVAVGRVLQERAPNELPAMDSQAFMMGDQVERVGSAPAKTGLPFE